MPPTDDASFALSSTYVHLAPTGAASANPVTRSFWDDLMAGRRRFDGRLVMAFTMERDWEQWERHPDGDELVVALSGAMDLVLDETGGERCVALRAGAACIVPRGVWHRGIVHEPGEFLFVTPGAGTEHRPV